jgi:hypothetical protein
MSIRVLSSKEDRELHKVAKKRRQDENDKIISFEITVMGVDFGCSFNEDPKSLKWKSAIFNVVWEELFHTNGFRINYGKLAEFNNVLFENEYNQSNEIIINEQYNIACQIKWNPLSPRGYILSIVLTQY